MVRQKVHSVDKHEGIPKGLKTKDRHATVFFFDSNWTAGVDCHYENELSSEESSEEKEEDSDHETELDSESESDGSSSDDDEE